MRGSKYGIDGMDILEEIPESIREPEMAYEYMKQKDISHKVPLSKGGDPAGDNWILEDSSVNRSRGAETMTPEEEMTAHKDAQTDARNIKRAALLGGGLAVGQAVVEGTILTIEAASLMPVILTGAAVAGAAYGTHRVVKHARKHNWVDRAKAAVEKTVADLQVHQTVQ